MINALKKWYVENFDKTLEDFFTFLSFKSISTDPHFKPDVLKTAKWLSDYLKDIGLDVEIWEGPGYPVVFGSYLKAGPSRPTLLLYHHYDVQPVDPLELWQSDPFEPTIRDNTVYARGAVDNKGQCFYSIVALKAYLLLAEKMNVNVKVFIEGEEESGGKSTAAIIQHKKEELKADYLLVVDVGIPDANTPAVTLGMRGIIALELECSNSSTDLHSGSHGGIALNPNRALATLLSGMWDQNGKVTIPHFYDDIRPLSDEHLFKLDLSFNLEDYQKSFGIKAFCPEEGYTLVESNWLRPTLEINGMSGGYAGMGFKTVIPAKAHAKISCRLVPNQDPHKIEKHLMNYFKSHAPKGIDVKVQLHHGAPGYRSSFDSAIVKTAALAYEDVFGKPCKYLLSGGSVPIVVDLANISGADVALIGMGLDSDNVHAPNECFGLDRFEKGFLTIGVILDRLSKQK